MILPYLRSIGDEFPWWFLPGWPVFGIVMLAVAINAGLSWVSPWWRRRGGVA